MPTTTNPGPKKPCQTCPALLAALADSCRAEPLREKWLVAPSRRLGHQWLDTVARAGQPVVNVRLHTLVSLALELAGPQLAADNRQVISPLGRVVLAGRLLRQLPLGYLGGVTAGLAFAERVAATLHDLRLAGLEPPDLDHGRFEAADKGRDIVALLRGYEQALADQHLVDDADLFQRARAALPLPAGVLVLVPADLEPSPLARRLLEALPATQRVVLPVDEPPGPDFTDAFRAAGEMNEVREVLRRCLAHGWPLDQVELLHTDATTYVPLVYELAASLQVPVTFADGLPVRYSRPGRALAAWLAWCGADFPQPALVALIRDELLEGVPGHLAAALRVVPIGFGRDRYLRQLDEQIGALDRQLTGTDTDEDGEARPEHRAALQRRREALTALRSPVAELLALASRPPLAAAAAFLRTHARCVNELDNYARDILLDRLAELEAWLAVGGEGLNPREWLPALLAETRVLGLGPRPGHLYVAGIEAGGHAGRPHTFIVGLDVNRFPAGGRTDPVLLDSERQELSPHLDTAATVRERAARRFERLRARLRGTVTASYSCRDVASDAELYSSLALPVTMTAALAPARVAECLSVDEWWLWRLCGAAPVREPEQLVAACFAWVARGQAAAAHRAGPEFTAYDGCVPAAGPDLDPAGKADRLFSAHRLETVGACALRYFYQYALGLMVPEELEIERDRWLPPAEFGQLLHEVFCRHLRDGGELATVLAERIGRYQEKFPPPNAGVLRRDCRRLERALRIFEAEETEWRPTGRPVDFERDISRVPIALPDGTTIHLRGRIDRVDETAGGLAVWDYKTGSTFRFRVKAADPFHGGRILQHAIYLELARAHYGKPVASFGYFFPTEKGRGERIVFTPAQLAGAPELLARLRGLIARGAFAATTDVKDCEYCDYRGLCGDVATVTAQSVTKLAEPDNTMLELYRQLRPVKEPK